MEKPYRIIADKGKNRLYIDFLTEIKQAGKIENEIWTKTKQLMVRWDCIVNFTKVDIPSTLGLLYKAETVMSFLKQTGMGQLVRVLTEEQSSLYDELKSVKIEAYEGMVAQTIQNANNILDRVQE